MINVYDFSDAKELGVSQETISYILENQIESFENFRDYHLLSFDYYDVHFVERGGHKIVIYLDREQVGFFCEDSIGKELVQRILQKIEWQNHSQEENLYFFFQELMRDDMRVLEDFEEMISNNEVEILKGTKREFVRRFTDWRKQLLRLKHYYLQLDIVFDEVGSCESEFLSKELLTKFVIFGRRTDRYLNKVEQLQEAMTQLREAYQSQLSIQQNELMKVFTVITAIFLPLTLMTGWYGMNFKYMPELEARYGYLGFAILAVLLVTGLILLFKHKKWF